LRAVGVLLVVRLVLDADAVRTAARQVVERLRARGHLVGRKEPLHREVPLVPESREVRRLETLAIRRQDRRPRRRVGAIERPPDALGLLGRGDVLGEPVVNLHAAPPSAPKRARTAPKAASVRSSVKSTSASVCAADRNQLCHGWSQTPSRAASPVKTFARSKVPAATSSAKVMNGSWTGPLWVIRKPWARACRPRPSRRRVPARSMRSRPRSFSSA